MITVEEYNKRRVQLAQNLVPGAVAIIPGAKEVLRNGDAHYRFRQNSDFFYLTGFEEPDACLVIINTPQPKSYLFNRKRHPLEEQWTGKRLGQTDAPAVLGVDAAYPIESLSESLPHLMADKQAIYYAFNQSRQDIKLITNAWKILKNQIRRGIHIPEVFYDLDPLLSEMRLIKSPAEISLMKKAAAASVIAHKQAMKRCSALNSEMALEAEILHTLMQQGCRNVAYDSIVAGGANACILHYTANNQNIHSTDLVLIDAGGEYNNYASDITRTIPASGRFSEDQALVYDIVLKAQQAAIAVIKPGLPWPEMQQIIVHTLTAGLVHLGILHGDIEELIAEEAYKPFYMHNSGHWLGLDVHDSGRYKISDGWRKLEPGMVLTVEPGLYISHNDAVPERFRGIGVRIEDDVLVTETGFEVLTGALPVKRADIEAIMCG